MFKANKRKTMFSVQTERVKAEEEKKEPEEEGEEPIIVVPKRMELRLPGVKLLRSLAT